MKNLRFTLVVMAAVASAVVAQGNPGEVSYREAISKLKAGNVRFAKGKRTVPANEPEIRSKVAEGQKPFACILTCADSRLSPELIFDQGLGSLFVIREAGNVVSTNELGSIEYAVEHLGTNYILVMGHTKCGVVTAAVAGGAEGNGNISGLLSHISPAVAAAKENHKGSTGDELVRFAIDENVMNSIKELLTQSEILRNAVQAGTLKIEGAVYGIKSGEIAWLGEHVSQAEYLKGSETNAHAEGTNTGSTNAGATDGGTGSEVAASKAASTPSGSDHKGDNGLMTIWICGFAAIAVSAFLVRLSGVQNWLRNLSIGKKLGFGFGLASFGILMVGCVGFFVKSQLASEAEYIGTKVVTHVDSLGSIGADIRDAQIALSDLSEAKSKEEITKAEGLVEEHSASAETEIEEYKTGATEPEDKKAIEAIASSWAEQEKILEESKSMINSGNKSGATSLMTEARHHFEESIDPLLVGATEWNHKHAAAVIDEVHDLSAKGTAWMIVAFLVIVSLVVSVALNISSNLKFGASELMSRLSSLSNHCLAGLQQSIEAMKSGDLTITVTPVTTPIQNPSRDEIGQMTSEFNTMLDRAQATIAAYSATQSNLCSMIGQVADEAKFVAATSTEMTEAAAQTSQAAQEVSVSVEQVAMAISQGASTSGQIATGSQDLANNAATADEQVQKLQSAIELVKAGSEEQLEAGNQASKVANDGGVAVQAAIESMDRIQAQVKLSGQVVHDLGEKQAQIGSIVQTIDEIAEQTNLLALNAAIEAARAGEHGRGFAVVAEEVRKLAERASTSTREIGLIIDQISQGVEEAIRAMSASGDEVATGAQHSSAASQALEEILVAIENVSTLAGSNAKQVDSMLKGIQTVGNSVTSVAAISQETAAAAEEMSAGGEEMAASAEEIAAAVEEQTASIEQVSAMAQDLSNTASKLQGLVNQFKYEESNTIQLVTSKMRNAA